MNFESISKYKCTSIFSLLLMHLRVSSQMVLYTWLYILNKFVKNIKDGYFCISGIHPWTELKFIFQWLTNKSSLVDVGGPRENPCIQWGDHITLCSQPIKSMGRWAVFALSTTLLWHPICLHPYLQILWGQQRLAPSLGAGHISEISHNRTEIWQLLGWCSTNQCTFSSLRKKGYFCMCHQFLCFKDRISHAKIKYIS